MLETLTFEHVPQYVGIQHLYKKLNLVFTSNANYFLKILHSPSLRGVHSLRKVALHLDFHRNGNPIAGSQTMHHKNLQLYLIIQVSSRRGLFQESGAVKN